MSGEERMQNDVAEIKECLIGNPLKNNPGLVNAVNSLDDKIGKIENRITNLERKKKNRRSVKPFSWFIKLFGF